MLLRKPQSTVHFWLADRRGHGTCLIFWRALGLGRLSLAAFALGGRLRREKIGVESMAKCFTQNRAIKECPWEATLNLGVQTEAAGLSGPDHNSVFKTG
jgi:hypothetical protein